MFSGFNKIVEKRIQTAQKKGEFENLSGAGKPLDLKDDRNVPEELRLAYKILKNADCIPPEIELKKEINHMEDLLSKMDDTAEKPKTRELIPRESIPDYAIGISLILAMATISGTSVWFIVTHMTGILASLQILLLYGLFTAGALSIGWALSKIPKQEKK